MVDLKFFKPRDKTNVSSFKLKEAFFLEIILETVGHLNFSISFSISVPTFSAEDIRILKGMT